MTMFGCESFEILGQIWAMRAGTRTSYKCAVGDLWTADFAQTAAMPLPDDRLDEQASANREHTSIVQGVFGQRERRDGHLGRQSKCRNVVSWRHDLRGAYERFSLA
jgi:hypothetical protein